MQMKDGKLLVEIADNGKGMDEAMIAHPESLGILSMQERARILNGEISFSKNNGKGTRVALVTPLHGKNQLVEQGDTI